MDEPVWRHGDLVMTWQNGCDGGKDCSLYIGNVFIGCITDDNEVDDWVTHLMDDEGGNSTVGFPTRKAAQSALVEAAVRALLGDAHG